MISIKSSTLFSSSLLLLLLLLTCTTTGFVVQTSLLIPSRSTASSNELVLQRLSSSNTEGFQRQQQSSSSSLNEDRCMESFERQLAEFQTFKAANSIARSTSKPVPLPTTGSNRMEGGAALVSDKLLSNACFQLEEMEDQDTCDTSVTLLPDGTVRLDVTDGPLFTTAHGTWTCRPSSGIGGGGGVGGDAAFTLELMIVRDYETGQQPTRATDIGEFGYTVERFYVGTLGNVGDRVSVEGAIYMMEDDNDNDNENHELKQVGYFEMIDARDD